MGRSPMMTHRLCEHVLFGKLIASGVCGTDRFCCSIIRVCPPQESGIEMRIRKIALKDFRGFSRLELDGFSKKVNVLIGKNAQGKTNFIESINYLSCGKSFRGASGAQMVREGCEICGIRAEYSKKSHNGKVEVVLQKDGRRSIKVNGLPARRMAELMGVANSIVFAPEDLQTVKGSPQLRRRLMDIEISKMRTAYYLELQKYYTILKNKNKILKAQKIDDALLSVYNEALCQSAEYIMKKREAFLAKLEQAAGEIFSFLAGGEELAIRYRACAELGHLPDSIAFKLQSAERREKELHTAMVGPHREDLEILINGRDARLYASQGQQRTAMLAIKLGCAKIAQEATGEAPILLLDDVFSELDIGRRERLLSLTGENQVFITATDAAGVEGFAGVQFFQAEEHRIAPVG